MPSIYLLNMEGQCNPVPLESEQALQEWGADENCWLWIDLTAGDEGYERQLLRELGINPLATEDFLRDRHPPKFEQFDEVALFLLRGLASEQELQAAGLGYQPVHISMLLGQQFLLTRHKEGSPSINKVMTRLGSRGYRQPQQLALSIMIQASRRHLEWLISIEDEIAEFEEQVANNPNDLLIDKLTIYRSQMRRNRRNYHYLERMAHQVLDEGIEGFYEPQSHKLVDLYERFERLSSLSAMFYDQLGDLIDGYLSTTAHRLNQTMRVLTVITAVFVPMSFLAGLYGMNFAFMPELSWKYSYFVLLGVMVLLASGLVLLFRRIRWL